jgi:hypothetical protein
MSLNQRVIRWFHRCFDANWVRCNNCLCRREYLRADVDLLRKCPVCGKSVRGYIERMNSAGIFRDGEWILP